MAEAQYVLVVASKTGWTEHFIRWELPLWRGWAYYHTARLLEGERCVWPGGDAEVDGHLDALQRRVRETLRGASNKNHHE